jgi:signal peptidase I
MIQDDNASGFDEISRESEDYEQFERGLQTDEPETEPVMESGVPPKFYTELYEWVETLTLALLGVVLLFTFVARTITVDGPSMDYTLTHGDALVITRLGGDPQPGDIVAVTKTEATNKPIIKRVIAVGGQTIDIDGATGDVYVDGELQNEPYIAEKIDPDLYYDEIFPQTIPEGSMFVMGDNRNNSWDSRVDQLGSIDTRHMLGRVILRYFPFGQFGNP